MSNVVIKRRMQSLNIDALNRTAIDTANDHENGDVVKLATQSTVDGENEVWTATNAGAGDVDVWMVHSPEVVIVKVGDNMFKDARLTADPRDFVNYKGMVFDVCKLSAGDIIEMTLVQNYLAIEDGKFINASSEPTSGLYLKKIGTGRLHIGQAGIAKTAIPTAKYEVVILPATTSTGA